MNRSHLKWFGCYHHAPFVLMGFLIYFWNLNHGSMIAFFSVFFTTFFFKIIKNFIREAQIDRTSEFCYLSSCGNG